MSGNGVVGHPVWPTEDGTCGYPDCGRRTASYGGRLQHLRGSGGRGGRVRADLMPAHEARRRVALLEAEVARLEAEVRRLEALDRPWVGLHAKLDRLLARAVAAPATHRRHSDGGRA